MNFGRFLWTNHRKRRPNDDRMTTEQLPSLTYYKLTANNCKKSIKILQKSSKKSLMKQYRNSFYKLLFKILKIWTNQAVTFSFCWNLQWLLCTLLGQTQEKLHIFFSSSFNFTKDSVCLDYFATNTSFFSDSINLPKCLIYVQRITQNLPSFCTVKPYLRVHNQKVYMQIKSWYGQDLFPTGKRKVSMLDPKVQKSI